MNGVTREVLGPMTYNVEVNGKCVKRHVNQMLSTKANPAQLTQVDSCVETGLDFEDFNTDGDLEQPVPMTVVDNPEYHHHRREWNTTCHEFKKKGILLWV